jgi:hypothetical protein
MFVKGNSHSVQYPHISVPEQGQMSNARGNRSLEWKNFPSPSFDHSPNQPADGLKNRLVLYCEKRDAGYNVPMPSIERENSITSCLYVLPSSLTLTDTPENPNELVLYGRRRKILNLMS